MRQNTATFTVTIQPSCSNKSQECVLTFQNNFSVFFWGGGLISPVLVPLHSLFLSLRYRMLQDRRDLSFTLCVVRSTTGSATGANPRLMRALTLG
jgi:hypothetical protein